jgi:hypothetical protein
MVCWVRVLGVLEGGLLRMIKGLLTRLGRCVEWGCWDVFSEGVPAVNSAH